MFSSLFTDQVPEKIDLQKLLHPLEFQWRIIGEALRIKYGDLMSLETNISYNDALKLSGMLQLWLDQRSTVVSWRTIISAIEEPPVNNPAIAEEMRRFLSQPSTLT